MYIALEGIVGAGKSTQIKLLEEYFKKKKKAVLIVREPGGTEIAEKIRETVQGVTYMEKMEPLCDVYLYAAARAQLIQGTIKPTLKRGTIVISDRCFSSSLSYQGYTQGIGIEKVREINQYALGGILPEKIFYLDIDIETGYNRTHDKDGDKWERKKIDFFEKVALGYTQQFKFHATKKRMIHIDASRQIEEIHKELVTFFE